MNNFYGILKIEEISDIIFDYYNKCNCYFKITCSDMDSKFNNRLLMICDGKIIDEIYKYININDYIYVHGRALNNKFNVICDRIQILD